MKTKTMTLQEFLHEDDIKNVYIKDKRIFNLSAFVLGNLMYAQKVCAAVEKVDKAGFTILGIVRSFGYWICIIMCIIEIIKSLLQGDTKSVGKIIAKYIIAFSAFYFLPWLFDIIKQIFA